MTDITDDEIEYWDTDDTAEYLIHDSIEEAVEAWADDHCPLPLPETIKVYGWIRDKLPPPEDRARSVLEDLLERIDEDFGSPDDFTRPNEAMETAAREFVAKVYAEYSVWRCSHVVTRDIKVADYIDVTEYLIDAEKLKNIS